jgi:hypothetical protein
MGADSSTWSGMRERVISYWTKTQEWGKQSKQYAHGCLLCEVRLEELAHARSRVARYSERPWRLQIHRHGSCSDVPGSGLSPIAKARSASLRASLSLSDIIRGLLGLPTHAPTWSLARLAPFRHQGRCAARMFQVAALGMRLKRLAATRFAKQGGRDREKGRIMPQRSS